MSQFEIGVLIGLGIVALLLWEIVNRIGKTHDQIIELRIDLKKKQ